MTGTQSVNVYFWGYDQWDWMWLSESVMCMFIYLDMSQLSMCESTLFSPASIIVCVFSCMFIHL